MESKAFGESAQKLHRIIREIEFQLWPGPTTVSSCRNEGCSGIARGGRECSVCLAKQAAQEYAALYGVALEESQRTINRYIDSYIETQNLRAKLFDQELYL